MSKTKTLLVTRFLIIVCSESTKFYHSNLYDVNVIFIFWTWWLLSVVSNVYEKFHVWCVMWLFYFFSVQIQNGSYTVRYTSSFIQCHCCLLVVQSWHPVSWLKFPISPDEKCKLLGIMNGKVRVGNARSESQSISEIFGSCVWMAALSTENVLKWRSIMKKDIRVIYG